MFFHLDDILSVYLASVDKLFFNGDGLAVLLEESEILRGANSLRLLRLKIVEKGS